MISWLRRRDQLLFMSTVRDTVNMKSLNIYYNETSGHFTAAFVETEPDTYIRNMMFYTQTWPDFSAVLSQCKTENSAWRKCKVSTRHTIKQKCISLSQHKQLHVQKITKNNVLNPTKGHKTADETSLSSLCCVQVETSWTLDWYSTSE